jgi:hypothetical protein
MEYHNPMKKPPDDPEFNRFTEAMKVIMSVPKSILKQREKTEKKRKQAKRAASPSPASSSTSVN